MWSNLRTAFQLGMMLAVAAGVSFASSSEAHADEQPNASTGTATTGGWAGLGLVALGAAFIARRRRNT